MVTSLPLTVFAAADTFSDTEESIRSAYMNDPEFRAHLAADPADAMDVLDNAVNNLGSIDPADEKKYIQEISASMGTRH
ncbi:hypothetical protein [Candidatus Contubernalis alkaliaceticus]|uniref:hypothetical protein n=1 Tax=Candidatus Contubernalis alkaliaceticus TaxID=338645 RepID=UPI001F4C1CB7|nr:hypothetical protein [Candidatus Contubernalis alkalaceticus]UNC92804.1 hypothetical protein HUE98_12275 [Candidatus Contubernalis alkalaceticus]